MTGSRRARRAGSLLLAGIACTLAGCIRVDPPATRARGDAALGQKIFMRTQAYSAALQGNALACTNCHIEGGRAAGSLSLEGAARAYPKRDAAGREITLEDRIVRCFTHSLNARPTKSSDELVAALAAYIASIAAAPGTASQAGADFSRIAASNLIPLDKLDAELGRQRYGQFCSGCHGLDGQGYRERRTPLPYDYVPPVWGPRSYNDAAGLARLYTLAGFLRHAMPRDDPGTIEDGDAQQIAAFVDGQPRPDYADKASWDGSVPVDAVYDTRQYPKNPFTVPLDLGP